MKVLWFTNNFLPERPGKALDLRGTGGWMSALMSALKDRSDLELSVACARPAQRIESYTANGIQCFVVPCGPREHSIDQQNALRDCSGVVDKVRPDLVHVHGTERFYGLLAARRLISCPLVISLQGLLGPYSEWYHYFGNRRLIDIVRMHRWRSFSACAGTVFSFAPSEKTQGENERLSRATGSSWAVRHGIRAYLRALNPSATITTWEKCRSAFEKALVAGEASATASSSPTRDSREKG